MSTPKNMEASPPTPLTMSITVTDVHCSDTCNNNGSIRVVGSGGTPWTSQALYSFSLVKSGTPCKCPCSYKTGYADGWNHLCAGEYNVTIQDSLGSSVTNTVTIYSNVAVVTCPWNQDFVSVIFPPLCWTNVAVFGTYVWDRVIAISGSGVGTGSARGNFYDQSDGNSYELITTPFDLSGLTSPLLEFNYAYATYITEVDEMDVYYST